MWLQGQALLKEISDKLQFLILALVCKKEHTCGQEAMKARKA